MFFDDNRGDSVYPQLLRSIAQTQRQLLERRFDWSKRQVIPQKKSGWFHKKPQDQERERLLRQLEDLKVQVQEHRRKMGYSGGVFWWNLSWEKIEDYLIYDLQQEADAGSWRFQRSFETQRDGDRIALFLHEEGHYSDFSNTTSYETGIISNYSEDEIHDKMRSYDKMMNNYDLMDLALAGDDKVHSYLSGLDYESMAHYQLSAEHYVVRSHNREQYARKLYTESETTTTTVYSMSRHYEALFTVAEFFMQGGSIQSLAIKNYSLYDARGDVPESIRELYASKDAAVACAAFLADSENIHSIPLTIFGNDLKGGAPSFDDAVRQAELYTCLADKIRV